MTVKIAGALGELSGRRADDLRTRRLSKIILAPDAISAKTSAARLLTTTLGGVIRHITNADLAAFSKSAKALGSKLRTGVTAQEIIDLSQLADRQRARQEIRSSIATRLHQGSVLFTTPSGPESKVTRHFVTIEFPGYGSAVSYPGSSLKSATELVKAPLKFDCDCPHHKFRHRFVATAMGCNSGRPESGFPKMTNPTLIGIACKHVIRTLTELQGSMFVRKQIAKMIDADRARLTSSAKTRVITTTRAEADKALKSRARAVRTTDEKHLKVIASSIKKASAGTPDASEINKTMATLQSRTDIPAQAILQALQAVMQQYPTGK
jgi:hypothetical protein